MRDLDARNNLCFPETFSEFSADQCRQSIHRLFEQQVIRSGDALAIRCASGDVTYAALNSAANQAAHLLFTQLSGETRPVALLIDQSYESIVWTLAILKAGSSYAPLDQRLPDPVLRNMIDNLRPGAIISAGHHLNLAHNLAAGRFPVISSDSDLHQFSGENRDRLVAPENIAYIFYTSGSTGAPKGVADCHCNVSHNILRYTNTLKFAPGDILSLVQNPSFSGTVSSLFGALLNGAAIAPFDLQRDGFSALSGWLRRTRVTVFHSVPSIFRQLSDPVTRFPDVRLVRLEGDRASALDIAHFQANFQDDCTLVNGLGATECGLVRQFFINAQTRLNQTESVPIGYAVPDMTVRIVDERGAELPPQTAGEIVVESEYLATGYWRNPELRNQRFVALDNGMRRYRTGDLGCMSDDGCLTHRGRVDQRIRVAGEFVDAAEIEGQLLKIAGVSQCAVRDFEDHVGERRLCAYLVAQTSTTVTQLRQALAERLAPPLVPSAFVFVNALPLTNDLKIDYQRLPPPGRQRPPLPNDFVAPRTATEKQIASLWSEVLEIDEIGVLDSFFDLGGDSLRAARFVTHFRERHGKEMAVASLFEHRRIRALTNFIDRLPQLPKDDKHPGAAANGNSAWPDHSIAIIGMAGRFPGADNLEQFWDNLRAGRESITLTDDGMAAVGTPAIIAAHGLLSHVDEFDAALFRLTPREAQRLDPQQRVWLECAHRALEDAGLPLSEAGFAGENNNIGVFAGGRESAYLWHLVGGDRAAVDALLQRSTDEARQLMISNDSDSIATRTSYLLNLSGPSVGVQSACSTSLVAVAQACQALVSGQCDMAIAGGVALTFPQTRSATFDHGGIHSRDGHCRAFDADATGAVFSDGVGAVVLKRLRDAIRDNDRIDAVIRGWAINNDGSNKASFAAPSVNGQTAAILRAQEHAQVSAHEIGYVEAHGTGTPIGDPIEFAALERAFRRTATERGFCTLGAVKTNIGHLDAAAGIAGLIKTVLVLKHREIPPTLHFQRANPEIALDASPFRINARLLPWPTDSRRAHRIAGVSSFGVGGTNCHVVLQEAPRAADDFIAGESPAFLLTLSAATAPALAQLEASYQDLLTATSGTDIASIAATSQHSRSHYRYRTAIAGNTVEQMRERLAQDEGSNGAPGRWRAKASGELAIGFSFSGQGAQYPGMGQELYRASRKFRSLLDDCDRAQRSHLKRPLLDVMFGAAGDLLQRTEYARPALFALQFSLAELLRWYGIKPRCVIGQGAGEYVAACIAGTLSLQDGIAVAGGDSRNDPHGGFAVQQPPLQPIGQASDRASTNESLDQPHTSEGMRHPRQYPAAMRAEFEKRCDVIVEVGPEVISTHSNQVGASMAGSVTIPILRRGENDWIALLEALAHLYVRGAPVDWAIFQDGRRRSPIRLPSYPFQRSRHWYQGVLASAAPLATTPSADPTDHPLLGNRLRLPGSSEIRFESRFSQTSPHFLTDHRLFGVSLPPAASHMAMLAQAAEHLGGAPAPAFQFEDLYLLHPLLLPDGCQRDVQLIFRPEQQRWSLELTSADSRAAKDAAWTPHMIGLGRSRPSSDQNLDEQAVPLAAIKARCRKPLSRVEFYSKIWANQGGTGSAFRWIDSIWRGDGEALCRAVCPTEIVDVSRYRLHPGLIEAACQVLHCCATIETEEVMDTTGTTFVPFSVDAFILFDAPSTHDEAWCHARLRDHSADDVIADLSVFNSAGQLVAKLAGFHLRPITRDAVETPRDPATLGVAEGRAQIGRRRVVAPVTAISSVQSMVRYLQTRCAELSGFPEAAITPESGFMALGLDSMVAMVLSNQIRRDFECAISATQILASKSIESLAQEIWQAMSR